MMAMLAVIFAVLVCGQLATTDPYNVLVLMVEKSLTNRFDLVHIGPAIDIAQKVLFIVISPSNKQAMFCRNV